MIRPASATASHPIAAGVVALPGGFALLEESGVLLCADAHLGYEDVMGAGRAAVPLWSTAEITGAIAAAVRRTGAREIVFLGDALHGTGLSDGAARIVRAALEGLRALATVTIIAGNHEGRTRGVAILGPTVEACERDGWMLVHGDKPQAGRRAILGHLHPAIRFGGDASVPAFLGARDLVVVPALTPYSTGLDVLGDDCATALAAWGAERRDVHVVGAGEDRVYPFGTLSVLRSVLRRPRR